jgi:hypothetical protein
MDFLRKAGAVSVQVTLHIPAIGTKEYEKTYETGKVLQALGEYRITNPQIDGSHAMVAGATPLWQKQLEMLLGYFRFYNPVNLVRSMRQDGSPLRKYRLGYQVLGFLGTLWSLFYLMPYILRLMFKKPTFHKKAPPASWAPVRAAKGSFLRYPDGLPGPAEKKVDREKVAA